jgi:hypothetical protein
MLHRSPLDCSGVVDCAQDIHAFDYQVVHKINALSRGKPENTVGPEEQVVIADCGEVKRR